jgi:hypothetical protein
LKLQNSLGNIIVCVGSLSLFAVNKKSYIEDSRAKVSLKSNVCMGHNANNNNSKFKVFLLKWDI